MTPAALMKIAAPAAAIRASLVRLAEADEQPTRGPVGDTPEDCREQDENDGVQTIVTLTDGAGSVSRLKAVTRRDLVRQRCEAPFPRVVVFLGPRSAPIDGRA